MVLFLCACEMMMILAPQFIVGWYVCNTYTTLHQKLNNERKHHHQWSATNANRSRLERRQDHLTGTICGSRGQGACCQLLRRVSKQNWVSAFLREDFERGPRFALSSLGSENETDGMETGSTVGPNHNSVGVSKGSHICKVYVGKLLLEICTIKEKFLLLPLNGGFRKFIFYSGIWPRPWDINKYWKVNKVIPWT